MRLLKINFKKALNRKLLEHKTKFSHLHQKQADAIAEVYKLLVEASSEVSELVNHEPSEELLTNAESSIETLKAYYRTHELYFPDQMGQKMDELLSKLLVAFRQYEAAAKSNFNFCDYGINVLFKLIKLHN